ncbi:MAG: hypothetical protein QOI08_1172 [Actinomycetota bacterium]|nr:hypothetical protein [Actinomycetota bacterium]
MTTNAAPGSSCRTAIRNAGALMLATAIIVAVMLTPASAASAATPRHIALAATYTGGPDTITSFRCVLASAPSTCHGTAEGAATYAGGWLGTSHYVYRFLVAPSGTVTVDISELFEGAVEGCGTGTFTVFTHETIEPSGTAQGRWVIPALGTDDLRRLTGTGTSTGSYAPDGAGGGQLTGRLLCQG